VMTAIANSRSPLLSPDYNPLLRVMIKPFVYDQFCAGSHKPEIQKTIQQISDMGFDGVIMQYAKEFAPGEQHESPSSAEGDPELEHWVKGNLETLDMIESGNWLGIKWVSRTMLGPAQTDTSLDSLARVEPRLTP
jgi:proline dehydrogenase